MRVSRKRSPFLYSYTLSGQVLGEVEDTKYLGVTLSDNLDWSKHITTTTTKANARLSFIKRNLKDCPKILKELAYFSLVRSFTDYCSTVWDPHQKYNHDKLEMVQRRCYSICQCVLINTNCLKCNSHLFISLTAIIHCN